MTLPLRAPDVGPAAELPDERALVERVRSGDEAVFGAVFRVYYASLCQFAYRVVGSADTAEEVVQEVFVRLWERRAVLDPERPLGAYLYLATRHAALNAERTRRRMRAVPVHQAAEIPVRTDGNGGDESRRLDLAMDRAIAQLPERCRLVFTLNREHGMSYAAIAEVLGISRNTVKTQMARALAALRVALAAHRP